MPGAPVTIDILQAGDVRFDHLSQFAFDLAVLFHIFLDLFHFLLREVLCHLIGRDLGSSQNSIRSGFSDAVNVCQRILDSLIVWNVYTD